MLREALAHMDMLADVSRRGLDLHFGDETPPLGPVVPMAPVAEFRADVRPRQAPEPAPRADLSPRDLPF